MGILQIPTQLPGTVGVAPNMRFMVTTDDLAAVTTPGYLNLQNNEGYPLSDTDIIQCLYNYNQQTGASDYGIFQVSINRANGQITLSTWVSAGDVLLPVVNGNFAMFNGTSGQIADLNLTPSDNTSGTVAMVTSSVQPNRIATYTNFTGSLSVNPATAITDGDIQVGTSTGSQRYFISRSPTATRGSLRVGASNNVGNFDTTISNASMGQSSTINIPDPAVASANFAVAPAALVNNNLIRASGTAGLVADAGIAVSQVMQLNATNTMAAGSAIVLAKDNGTEAGNAVTANGVAGVITTSALATAGGASYSITWTNSKITASSVVLLTISGGTNTVQQVTVTCTPGAGTATIDIYNTTAATPLNGTILLSYAVL